MNKTLALLLSLVTVSIAHAESVDFKKYVMNNVPKDWTIYFDKNIESQTIDSKDSWENTLLSLKMTDVKINKDDKSKTLIIKKMNNDAITSSSAVVTKKKDTCCVMDKQKLAEQLSVAENNTENSSKGISYTWLKDRSVSYNLKSLSLKEGYLFTDKSWQVYSDGVFSDYVLDINETFTAESLEDVYDQILGRISYLGIKACFFDNKYIKIVNRKESNGDTKCIED